MPKHPLMYDESPEDRKARRRDEYEERLVGQLISRYGLSKFKGALRRQAQQDFGTARLTMYAFMEHFGFPIHLSVDRFGHIAKECTVDKLFNNFSTRRMTKTWFELREEAVENDKAFGLVMPWPYVSKGMVLHDYPVVHDELLPELKKPLVRVTWTLPKSKRKFGDYLTLEPIDQLLTSLNWKPELDE